MAAEREPARPADYKGSMQVKTDDPNKPYVKTAVVDVWYSKSPEGKRPNIRAKVMQIDENGVPTGKISYISAWES